MRRPNFLLRWTLALCLLFVVGQYGVLAWLLPRFAVYAIEHATGNRLAVERAFLSFPLTVTLDGVHLAQNTDEAALTIPRVVLRPRWVSLPSRTLWLESVEIEALLLRVSRDRAGVACWPAILQQKRSGAQAGAAPWRIHIGSVSVSGGVLEFQDREPAQPFHGALDHISLSVGPVAIPPLAARRLAQREGRSLSVSFAVRGRFAGYQGPTAPFYCSGWTDLTAKDLQASCQVEPIPLAAFEPYFSGQTQLRAYTSTVRSSSYWTAKANELTGRVQLELGNLVEGDLSFRGRTVVSVKKLAGGPQLRLSGAVVLSGPLDRPWEWDAEFLTGDAQVRLLVERLFEYGVRVIKIPLGGYPFYVRIAPATPEMMADIEAVSREVREALELLVTPAGEESAAPGPALPQNPPPAGPSVEGVPSQSPPAPVSPEPSGTPAPVAL